VSQIKQLKLPKKRPFWRFSKTLLKNKTLSRCIKPEETTQVPEKLEHRSIHKSIPDGNSPTGLTPPFQTHVEYKEEQPRMALVEFFYQQE